MKIVSFNINGLRARLHQLQALIDTHQPDIIGLQEIKVDNPEFPIEAINAMGYHAYFHGQKGHYGVAILSKIPAKLIQYGFPVESIDAQKRMIIAHYSLDNGSDLILLNGYFPQGENRSHPQKFPAKYQFYHMLRNYLETSHNPDQAIIVLGDINISETDLDIGIGALNATRWLKTGVCSFLPEEREWLQKVTSWGLYDTFRHIHPNKAECYSWFDYRSRGFDENRGLRIDQIMATKSLLHCCTDADIDYKLRAIEKPSDHAPIWSCFEVNIIES